VVFPSTDTHTVWFKPHATYKTIKQWLVTLVKLNLFIYFSIWFSRYCNSDWTQIIRTSFTFNSFFFLRLLCICSNNSQKFTFWDWHNLKCEKVYRLNQSWKKDCSVLGADWLTLCSDQLSLLSSVERTSRVPSSPGPSAQLQQQPDLSAMLVLPSGEQC